MELQLKAATDVKVATSETTTPAELSAEWSRVRTRLQSEVGEVEYRTWLRQMSLGGTDGDEVTVLLPTRFLRDWVRSHYGDRISAVWQAENGRVRRVDIRVGRSKARAEFRGSQPVMVLRRMRILLRVEQLLQRDFQFFRRRKEQNHARKILAGFHAGSFIGGNCEGMRGVLHANYPLVVDGAVNALRSLRRNTMSRQQQRRKRADEQSTTPNVS